MLKEQVLYLLEQNREQIVTGGELARKLGVSRTAIWKAVHTLKEGGSEIETIPNSGYRLTGESDTLLERSIRDRLTCTAIGKTIEILPTVHSTNRYLKGMDTAALKEGYVVIADEQTGGRGRMDRPFHSPAGQGLYLSIFLRPPVPAAESQLLTICAAVAACRAIEAACSISPAIKWVNDLYGGGKKLCGILTEAFVSAEAQAVDWAIIGIGINTGYVAQEVADTATSIRQLTGKKGVRNRLAAELLNAFEQVYRSYVQEGKKSEIITAYTKRLLLLDTPVQAVGPRQTTVGTVQGIDEFGALLLQAGDGTVHRITGGEIRSL